MTYRNPPEAVAWLEEDENRKGVAQNNGNCYGFFKIRAPFDEEAPYDEATWPSRAAYITSVDWEPRDEKRWLEDGEIWWDEVTGECANPDVPRTFTVEGEMIPFYELRRYLETRWPGGRYPVDKWNGWDTYGAGWSS